MAEPIGTLPDHLKTGLDLVLVGLNPGLQSARVGHYFASPRNRFWRAANQAGLFDPPLCAEGDHRALAQGIGFTDVVKRASSGSADLRAADFRRWAPVLEEKLVRYGPRIVCFHGMVAYRNFLRYGPESSPLIGTELGPQSRAIGVSKVYVVPNPSPANAAYSPDDLAAWYSRLRAFREETAGAH
jgi:TDG/mug DNA glycosylase family protein